MENVIDISNKTSMGVSTRTGIFTGVGLILYFLIMRAFGLHQQLEFHYLNIVVLLLGLRHAIKQINENRHGEIRYFEGLKAGIIVTCLAVLIFGIFMLIYQTIIDKSFLVFLNENLAFGRSTSLNQTVVNVMGVLAIEGLSSGFILTFILMQFYKSRSSATK